MIDFSDKQIEQLMQDIFDGVITERELPENLYHAIADCLNKGVYQGFDGNDEELLIELRENIFIFSAAKTFSEVKEMSALLVNSDIRRSFSEFKAEAMKIYDNYNVNWLRTEYETAVGQSQMACKWDNIEKEKKTLPYLKYSAVIDTNTSDICRPLDGTTLPVDHPFWNTFSPLNHFNCRCLLEQIGKYDDVEITPKGVVDDLRKKVGGEMQDVFKMNPGKDKVIFSDAHPYFDVAKKDRAFAKENFGLKIPKD